MYLDETGHRHQPALLTIHGRHTLCHHVAAHRATSERLHITRYMPHMQFLREENISI